jgi:nucleoside 2-deoxyribosyltransferase
MADHSAAKVYLAGPITGLNYKGCTDWREEVKKVLAEAGIRGISPMRGKEYLDGLGALSGTGEEYADLGVMSTPRGVMTRDHWDCTRCDVVLVNLLGSDRVSIGTVMEIAWAFMGKRPVICVIEDGNENVHSHMMIFEAIGYRVTSLDQAMHIIKAMFS